jgi:hypothetical protein
VDDATWTPAWAAGRALPPEQAVAEALAAAAAGDQPAPVGPPAVDGLTPREVEAPRWSPPAAAAARSPPRWR